MENKEKVRNMKGKQGENMKENRENEGKLTEKQGKWKEHLPKPGKQKKS